MGRRRSAKRKIAGPRYLCDGPTPGTANRTPKHSTTCAYATGTMPRPPCALLLLLIRLGPASMQDLSIDFRSGDGQISANGVPFSIKVRAHATETEAAADPTGCCAQGVNWFGAEGENGTVEGLTHGSLDRFLSSCPRTTSTRSESSSTTAPCERTVPSRRAPSAHCTILACTTP